jgi:hypothetical protein
MKLIKIVNGTYGHKAPGARSVYPKSAGDPPFEVDDAKADRLVTLGVAAYVTTDENPGKAVSTPDSGENKTETGKAAPEGNEGGKPSYNSKMRADELKELLKKYGLSYRVGMSKDVMVAALDEYFSKKDEDAGDDSNEEVTDDKKSSDTEDEIDDGETPPALSAEDPVI